MALRVWKAKDIVKGWRETPIRIMQFEDPFDDDSPAEVGDMRVLDAMLVIANRAEVKTLDAAGKARSVKKAVLKSVKSGKIELEPDVFKWLKAAAEQVCPLAWGDNANEVYDIICEGFQYDNESPKRKKAASAEAEADAAAAK